jgi:hypothetical protein
MAPEWVTRRDERRVACDNWCRMAPHAAVRYHPRVPRYIGRYMGWTFMFGDMDTLIRAAMKRGNYLEVVEYINRNRDATSQRAFYPYHWGECNGPARVHFNPPYQKSAVRNSSLVKFASYELRSASLALGHLYASVFDSTYERYFRVSTIDRTNLEFHYSTCRLDLKKKIT